MRKAILVSFAVFAGFWMVAWVAGWAHQGGVIAGATLLAIVGMLLIDAEEDM